MSSFGGNFALQNIKPYYEAVKFGSLWYWAIGLGNEISVIKMDEGKRVKPLFKQGPPLYFWEG